MHHIWDMPMSVDTWVIGIEYNGLGQSMDVWIQEPWIDGEKQEMDSTCRFHFLRTFDKVPPTAPAHFKTFRWGGTQVTPPRSVHVFLEYL
jgi:hypothetical protein